MLKRSYIKRGTKTLKRSGFKRPTGAKMALKRGVLRKIGISPTATLKREIQALVREIVIKRDKGCWLRHYGESGACGGYRKDGELILQFDHLHSRTHSVSFSDPRLGVCICVRHHIYWKKQYPAEYEKYVRDYIGKERCTLLDRVREDRGAYKIDLKLELIHLKQVLKELQ